jgi:hypothetical protein
MRVGACRSLHSLVGGFVEAAQPNQRHRARRASRTAADRRGSSGASGPRIRSPCEHHPTGCGRTRACSARARSSGSARRPSPARPATGPGVRAATARNPLPNAPPGRDRRRSGSGWRSRMRGRSRARARPSFETRSAKRERQARMGARKRRVQTHRQPASSAPMRRSPRAKTVPCAMTNRLRRFASRVMVSWARPPANPPRATLSTSRATNGITAIDARRGAAAGSSGLIGGITVALAAIAALAGRALASRHASRSGRQSRPSASNTRAVAARCSSPSRICPRCPRVR